MTVELTPEEQAAEMARGREQAAELAQTGVLKIPRELPPEQRVAELIKLGRTLEKALQQIERLNQTMERVAKKLEELT